MESSSVENVSSKIITDMSHTTSSIPTPEPSLSLILSELKSLKLMQNSLQERINVLNKENIQRYEEIKIIAKETKQLITDDDTSDREEASLYHQSPSSLRNPDMPFQKTSFPKNSALLEQEYETFEA